MTEPSTAATVRRLLRTRFRAALGTLAADSGAPYVSLVALATAPDASPLLYLSRLAEHTRNLFADARAALLVDATDTMALPLAGERATLCGRMVRCDDPALLDRYLRFHPDAVQYRAFGDFELWRMELERVHLVAGFGRIAWIPAAEVRLPEALWRPLASREAEALAHLQADHAATLEGLATALLGRAPGAWRAIGLDPEGLDLAKAGERARLAFPEPVRDSEELRAMLRRLAEEARQRAQGHGTS
ncbi:hypothetical protein HRbin40_00023 [bacterium HR40]|nr:hypothetical protein HRbin40_00023 [bacterium HR40]